MIGLDDLKAAFGSAYADADPADERGILNEVRLVVAGLITTLVVVLVLTEVWNAIDPQPDGNGGYNGTFGGVYGAVEGTGSAALSLIVVGFLVVAAVAIMRFFGGGMGGMGGMGGNR